MEHKATEPRSKVEARNELKSHTRDDIRAKKTTHLSPPRPGGPRLELFKPCDSVTITPGLGEIVASALA